jgi:hypothetical protein
MTSEVLFTPYHTLHAFCLDVSATWSPERPPALSLIPLPAERCGQSGEWRPPIRPPTLLSSGSIEVRRR